MTEPGTLTREQFLDAFVQLAGPDVGAVVEHALAQLGWSAKDTFHQHDVPEVLGALARLARQEVVPVAATVEPTAAAHADALLGTFEEQVVPAWRQELRQELG